MARVASPLDRWAPYSRDDARDERTSFTQPQHDFGGFSSTSFNASSQRPTLSHLRLDSDSGINYGPGAAAAAAAAVVRRTHPRAGHSMDAITSANEDAFYRSPDQYQQSPLPAAFSSPDTTMSMDWVSSAPPTSHGRPTTAGHQSRPSYFGEPQYDSFGAVVAGDAPVNLQSASHASPPTQSASYPYSPPGSFSSSSASYMQQQQQQARQRAFSNRTDASSPPPTANSTTTIDPSLQDPAANNIWVSSAAQAAYNSGANQGKPTSSMSRAELEAEITRLRQRVSELEIGYHWSELKVMKLEAEAHRSGGGSTSGSSGAATSDSSGSRSPAGGAGDRPSIPAVMGGVAPSEEFAASWRARTDARIKRFCALNRAGNALCAWHDSRRERRAYPPRQAPPGYLNCGCTNEEGSWLSLSCPPVLSCLLSRPAPPLSYFKYYTPSPLPLLPHSPGLKRDG
jgi:hypothetical protein